MKKLFISIALLYLAINSFAQIQRVKNLTTFDEKQLHFGFTIAINTLDFRFQHFRPIGENPDFVPKQWNNIDGNEISYGDTVHADIAEQVPGLTVGIVTSLRLGEYFDLRFLPGLSFGERRLVYNVPIYDINAPSSARQEYYSIKSTYIDLPLLVKYKSSRLNNQRPYLIAGPAFRVDISKTGVEDLVRVKRGGFYLEAGIGWDSYLRFFRLSTELKVSLGVGNILNSGPDETQRQYYTSAIEKLSSNVFTLSFHFE
ncbi:porin family protein [uncultured Sunxiuqinia sp.]|uniref:type IX secretion/gliding motility protein PorT/SprT n=1 Tax=uncultured Sunxiuqinia sp. TaxID=1573825 RepID=UPI002AA66F74|nr:porin family protein [uncultured Sunxiuqinia sp.]